MKARIFKYFLFFAVLATSVSALGAEYVLSFVYTQVGSEDTKYNICGYFDKDKIILDSDFGWNKGKDDVCNRNNGGEIDDYMMCKNAANACSRANYSFNTNTITLTLDTKCKDHGTYTGPTVTIDGKSKSFGSITYDSDKEQKTVAVELTGVSAGNHDVSVAFAGSDKFYVKTLTITQTSAPATTYALTLSNDGNGTAASDQKNDAAIPENTFVTITATPKEGYKFVNWTGSSTETDNPFTFSMTEAKSYQANFEETSQTCVKALTIQAESEERIEPTGGTGKPSSLQFANDYYTGWTGTGYMDYKGNDGELYYPMKTSKAANLTFTIYYCNGQDTYLNVYKKGAGSDISYGGQNYGKVQYYGGWTNWDKSFSGQVTSTVNFDAGEYILGIYGKQWVAFDKIDISASDDVFCTEITPTHTLTWDFAGGTATDENYTKAGQVEEGAALTAPTLTKTGYNFNTWSPAVPKTMPDSDVTYTASWNIHTYNITYYNIESTEHSNPATYTIESEDITLANPTATRTGYTFGGWYLDSDFNTPITKIATGSHEDKNIYAKWIPSETTVTLDVQSGSGGTSEVTATYGAAMPAITLPTRSGYAFNGYFTQTNGEGTKYYNADGSSATNWDILDATKTLYAYWTVDYCKPYIQLDCNDYDASKVTSTSGADGKATIEKGDTYAKITNDGAIYLPVTLEAGTYYIKVSGQKDDNDVWANYLTQGTGNAVTFDGQNYGKTDWANVGTFGSSFTEKTISNWEQAGYVQNLTLSGGNYLFSITGHTNAEYQWIRIYKASGEPFCPETYDLIVTTDGNGTTSTVPAVTTDLLPGTSVTLTATPNDDYRFKNWTIGGSVVATMNPYTLTVDSTTTIQANFEYIWTYYDITLGSSLNGNVAITVGGEPHDGKHILVGTDVVLTATPNSDAYAFQQWQDGNTDNPRTIQVSAETATEMWTATFTPTYLVTATVDEFGKEVIGSGVKYGGGNTVTLTAVSNVEGYQLKEWVDVTGIMLTEEQRTSNPLVFTMQYQEVSLKATFMPVECTDTLIIQCEDLSKWITETDEKMTKTPVPRPNSGMCGNYSNHFLDYHGSGYFDIKSAALDHAVQKYYKLTLPAGTFSFTIWTAADNEAQDCRMYIYTPTDGEGEVTYDGVNYSQAGWAQVDHVEPAPAHFGIGGVISNITLPSKQTVFVALYIGAGGESAAFDQIKIQADSTVFCTEIVTDVWSIYGNFDGEWKDYVLTDGGTTIPDLEKDSSYPFKLHKASYGDKHFYYGATSPTNSYNVSGAAWIMDGQFDVNLSTEARGDYLFSATNFSQTYPQVTITYPTSYTIAFNDNGADGGAAMEYIVHLAAGDSVVLPMMTRTKTGYRFAGWKDGSDNAYADGAKISTITDNIVLTAQWEKRVTGLTITQAQGLNEVVAGEQLQLSVEYTPSDAAYGQSVIWTSSNTTYLTVDENGLVTGVAIGNGHYITATNPDGVSNTYYINVTSFACENVWQVHMWNTDMGTNTSLCMHQIGSTTEWQTAQVALPSASNAEQLKVLYNGADQTHTAQWNTNWVPFVGHQYEDAPAAMQFYPMENSMGYFRIYTDNTTDNYFLAFQPTYRITMGEEGQDWQAYDFIQIANGREYETERIQVPSNYKSMNYYVGTKHSNGTTTIYVQKDSQEKSKTQALSGINGLSGEERAGQFGTYHIYDNSKDYNWYCEFRLYYMYRMLNEDGSSFYLSDGVYSGATEKGTTLYAPTPSKFGYNFARWQRKNTSVYFDAGGAYTYCSAMDTLLPVFTPKQYTITLLRNRGESDGQATATYRSNTLSDLTHVGERAGYTLLGYYISTASDVKVINADGTLVAGVEDYTDAEGNWIKDGDCTLYAQWQSNMCTPYLQLNGTDYDASKISIHYDADAKASITDHKTYVTLSNNGAIYLPVALEAGVYNIQVSGRNEDADAYINFFTGVETSCNITCDGLYYSKTAYHNMGTFGNNFEEKSWNGIAVAGGNYLFGIAGHTNAEYRWIRIYKADDALFCPEEPEEELLVSLTSDSHFESLTGAGNYTVGAIVTAYATASEDYVFLNWTSEDGQTILSTENPYTFMMPNTNLTIKANAQEDRSVKHLVTTTMGAPGQEVLGGNRSYSVDSEVSLLALSGRNDYKLKRWMEISGINLSDAQRTANPLKFSMPYSEVTLKAIFAPMECTNTLMVQCEDQSYWIDESDEKMTKTPVPMPQSSQCGTYNDHYEGYHGSGYFDMKSAAYDQAVQKYYKMILPAGTFSFTFWTAADDIAKDSRAYIYTQTDGEGEVTYDGVNYRQVGFAQIDHAESNPARFGVGGAICNITIPDQQIVLVALYAGEGGLSASFDQIKVTTNKDVFCHEISTDTYIIHSGEEKEIPVCGVDNLIIYEGGSATNTDDVEVYTSAQYKRTVAIDKWETFALPYTANVIYVHDTDDGLDYQIWPTYKSNGTNKAGYFYMEQLKDTLVTITGDDFRQRWMTTTTFMPQVDSAYIIKYPTAQSDGYFAEKEITYKLTKDGCTLRGANSATKYEDTDVYEGATRFFYYPNNSVVNIQLETSAYILNDEGTYFEVQERPVIPPFHCYIQTTEEMKRCYPRLAMFGGGRTPTLVPCTSEDISNVVVKLMDNQQLIIIRNGLKYNAQGALIR